MPDGHFVSNAHDVADAQAARDADVDTAYGRDRLPIEVARFEIAVPDRGIALSILAATRGGDGFDASGPIVDGRRSHVEPVERTLAGTRESEGLRRRRDRPSWGNLQRQHAVRPPLDVIEHLGRHVDSL